MKVALIVTDKFTDQKLLDLKLDELRVTEVISGTTNGYEMLENYIESRPEVKIKKSTGHMASKAYNAINESDNVVIFANGDGKRTELSIANALNENKKLRIYSYKQKAFSIKKEDEYIKISLSGNLQKSTKLEGVYLNKKEVKNLIEQLNTVIND